MHSLFLVCLPQIQPLVRTSGYRGFLFYSTLGHAGGVRVVEVIP